MRVGFEQVGRRLGNLETRVEGIEEYMPATDQNRQA